MSKFASNTDVPVERSNSEIKRTLEKYGAMEFMFGQTSDKAIVAFKFKERAIRFVVPFPARKTPTKYGGFDEISQQKWDQLIRQRFRCLLLVIKAKLELVESGIVTVEQEFMPYLIMANGATMYDNMKPNIDKAILDGHLPTGLFDCGSQKMLVG